MKLLLDTDDSMCYGIEYYTNCFKIYYTHFLGHFYQIHYCDFFEIVFELS